MVSPPEGRVIIKMSVRIPDGREGTIHVFPDDEPRELAVKVPHLRAEAGGGGKGKRRGWRGGGQLPVHPQSTELASLSLREEQWCEEGAIGIFVDVPPKEHARKWRAGGERARVSGQSWWRWDATGRGAPDLGRDGV